MSREQAQTLRPFMLEVREVRYEGFSAEVGDKHLREVVGRIFWASMLDSHVTLYTFRNTM